MSTKATKVVSPKTERLQLRISPEVKQMIRLAASLERVSISALVLSKAEEAAEQVIEGETHIELGQGASLQVARALKRPPRAVPALVDFFRD